MKKSVYAVRVQMSPVDGGSRLGLWLCEVDDMELPYLVDAAHRAALRMGNGLQAEVLPLFDLLCRYARERGFLVNEVCVQNVLDSYEREGALVDEVYREPLPLVSDLHRLTVAHEDDGSLTLEVGNLVREVAP